MLFQGKFILTGHGAMTFTRSLRVFEFKSKENPECNDSSSGLCRCINLPSKQSLAKLCRSGDELTHLKRFECVCESKQTQS